MDHFELVSEYAPTGDQLQAIADLVKGFKEGNQCETLPLAVQHYGEFKEFFPNNAVEYLSPSVPEPENGGYMVLFGADLSVFCGGNEKFGNL